MGAGSEAALKRGRHAQPRGAEVQQWLRIPRVHEDAGRALQSRQRKALFKRLSGPTPTH